MDAPIPQDVGSDFAALERDGVLAQPHASGVPLMLRPAVAGLAADGAAFAAWFRDNKDRFDRLASVHGALLFRGFPLTDTADFQRAIEHYPSDLTYVGGVSARTQIAERVFESTHLPKRYSIPLHQEMTYLPNYPRMVCFFSRRSAWAGGETILGDVRVLEQRLPRRVFERVKACGVTYHRNFRAPDLAVSPARAETHKTWPDAFGSDDPAAAEAACRIVGLEPVWEDDGSLSTRWTGPGFVEHPLTGRITWFSQALVFNPARARMGAVRWREFQEARVPGSFLPQHTVYGDGHPIDQEDIEAIYPILDSLTVALRWTDGDLLLVDNVMTAHGRNPYEGDRDLQVALLG